MRTDKKSPTPLDVFPNGKIKKAAEPKKVTEKMFEGEIDLDKFKEALNNKKFSEKILDVARDFFGYNGITQSISYEGHTIGVSVRVDSGYALVMEWGDLQRLTPRDNPKFFDSLEATKEYCVDIYLENPYRPAERYNVNRHW